MSLSPMSIFYLFLQLLLVTIMQIHGPLDVSGGNGSLIMWLIMPLHFSQSVSAEEDCTFQ